MGNWIRYRLPCYLIGHKMAYYTDMELKECLRCRKCWPLVVPRIMLAEDIDTLKFRVLRET